MAYLPQEILSMICTQLRLRQDFDTLFNCACSGRQFATIALTNLYRIPKVNVTPLADGCHDRHRNALLQKLKMNDSTWVAHEARISKKRACLWRTIILSSLGKTLWPYSQYIRTLDLQDLFELLKYFLRYPGPVKGLFQGELVHFKVDEEYDVLNLENTMNKIVQAITKQTTQLEELNTNVRRETLARWIPRLPRLTNLTLCRGMDVTGNGNLIRLHCPSFKGLKFSDWFKEREFSACGDSNSDQDLAAFLNELRPQSLESFKTCPYRRFGPQSLQALSCHGESLAELELQILGLSTIPIVSLLKDCTNLVSLLLAGDKFTKIDLGGSYRDDFAFAETVGADFLVDSLSKLVNLTNLRLINLCYKFTDRHIVRLASSLPKLETWSTDGYQLTDAIWDAVVSLESLRRLQLGELARFTADGILDFIEKLGPGNKGLVLGVRSVDIEGGLIEEKLARKVEGRLEVINPNMMGLDNYLDRKARPINRPGINPRD